MDCCVLFRVPTSSSRLVIFNVSPLSTSDDLADLFSPFGILYELVIKSKISFDGSEKHFAFVKYYCQCNADNAMRNLQGYEVMGRKIKIVKEENKENHYPNQRNNNDNKVKIEQQNDKMNLNSHVTKRVQSEENPIGAEGEIDKDKEKEKDNGNDKKRKLNPNGEELPLSLSLPLTLSSSPPSSPMNDDDPHPPALPRVPPDSSSSSPFPSIPTLPHSSLPHTSSSPSTSTSSSIYLPPVASLSSYPPSLSSSSPSPSIYSRYSRPLGFPRCVELANFLFGFNGWKSHVIEMRPFDINMDAIGNKFIEGEKEEKNPSDGEKIPFDCVDFYWEDWPESVRPKSPFSHKDKDTRDNDMEKESEIWRSTHLPCIYTTLKRNKFVYSITTVVEVEIFTNKVPKEEEYMDEEDNDNRTPAPCPSHSLPLPKSYVFRSVGVCHGLRQSSLCFIKKQSMTAAYRFLFNNLAVVKLKEGGMVICPLI